MIFKLAVGMALLLHCIVGKMDHLVVDVVQGEWLRCSAKIPLLIEIALDVIVTRCQQDVTANIKFPAVNATVNESLTETGPQYTSAQLGCADC